MRKRSLHAYAKALDSAVQGAPEHAPMIADAFVAVLRRDGLLAKLPRILEAYERLTAQREGAPLHVVTKLPLDAKTKKMIHAVFGAQRPIVHEIDETLMGGFRLLDGDTVYDGTVDTQLKTFHEAIRKP